MSQILWGFGGETPIAEEEATACDETKGLRASALLIDRRSGWKPLV
jgi:hypothetical protein